MICSQCIDVPLSSGRILVGNRNWYRIEHAISAGGMGHVYSARSSTGEKVIVKTSRLHGDNRDHVRLEKLRTEAKILSMLNHKNIIRYIDHGEDQSGFFLVTEMIHGQTMKEIYQGRPASEPTTKKYVSILLEILRYLHKHQVIHRDINPNNLLLEASRQMVLIDFGAAKLGQGPTAGPDQYIGTECWSDPEQFTAGVVGACNDIYAVGATMFFLLTGEAPKKYLRNRRTLTKLPHQINSSVSRELSDIVKIAMDPDPAKRFQTADSMINLVKKGHVTGVGEPSIILQGKRYAITGELEIGRTHRCDSDCRSKGFLSPIDLSVDDPGNYIEKHHARLYIDRSGACWIQDLGSLNRTAISRDAGRTFKIMPRNGSNRLHEGDTVAIVYSNRRRAYMTFTFRTM